MVDKSATPVGSPPFPPVPEALRSRNPFRYLKFYGPGAIIASVTIGTGETVFASRGGALFGYALLWCFLLGALLKGVQVYSGMRVMILTGNHPVRYWSEMSGPRGWFPLLIASVSLLIIPGMYSALPKFLASFLIELWPSRLDVQVAVNLAASLILISCALLALRSSYRLLERAQLAIMLLFLLFVLVSFVAFRPDLEVLLRNAFSIGIPDYPDWVRESYPAIYRRPPWVEVMTYIGILGGNSTDYVAYLSFLRDKGWGRVGRPAQEIPVHPSREDVAAGRFWLRAPLTDVWVSFSVVVLFTFVFLVLGAAILAPARQVPADAQILTAQASFLTRIHSGLFPLYVVGIVSVFLGTIYGAFELHTRALYECGRALVPSWKESTVARIRLGVLAYGAGSGLLLIWTNWDPVALVTPASLVGGLFACGLWCLAMLWVDRRFLPASFRMGIILKLAVLLSGVVLTIFGLKSIFDFLEPILC